MSKDASKAKPVGLTALSGYQIGVRRTLPISKEQAWEHITSPGGLNSWLGDLDALQFHVGEKYGPHMGISGEIRIVKPCEQLRMTWKKSNWQQPSILQIRLIASTERKTTISFHQEKLDNSEVREEMKRHWEEVLSSIDSLLS